MATHAQKARTPRVRAERGTYKTTLTAEDLDTVREMIEVRELSLSQIARALNFASHGNLIRALKAHGLRVGPALKPIGADKQV